MAESGLAQWDLFFPATILTWTDSRIAERGSP
jgi:hypothetical protein